MRNVQAILKKEQKAKEVLDRIKQEKETLALKEIASTKQILAMLDCEYLLEATTIEKVVEKEVEKIVERIVEVEVPVEVVKEVVKEVPGKIQVVKDMEEIEKHLDTIKAKDKEIETLKKTVATWQSKVTTASKDNSKDKEIIALKAEIEKLNKQMDNMVQSNGNRESRISQLSTELENANKEIEKLRKSVSTWQSKANKKDEEIQNLKAELETAKTKTTKTRAQRVKEMFDSTPELEDEVVFSNANTEEDDYMAFLATQEESIMSQINSYNYEEECTIVEEVKQDTKDENANIPKFVKVARNKVGRNANAKLYQTEKCYLIASPTTDEITWLSHETLTDEYKIAVENALVKDYNFMTSRTKLSPIVVNRDNGYMARGSAKNGTAEFSKKDVLVGYVKLNNKFYLYSYTPIAARAHVDMFDAVLQGASKTMPIKSIVDKVTAIVIDMYKEYDALLNAKMEVDKKKAEEIARKHNDKQEARRAQREADEALIAKAGLLNKIKKDSKPVPSALEVLTSDSMLDDIEDELF